MTHANTDPHHLDVTWQRCPANLQVIDTRTGQPVLVIACRMEAGHGGDDHDFVSIGHSDYRIEVHNP